MPSEPRPRLFRAEHDEPQRPRTAAAKLERSSDTRATPSVPRGTRRRQWGWMPGRDQPQVSFFSHSGSGLAALELRVRHVDRDILGRNLVPKSRNAFEDLPRLFLALFRRHQADAEVLVYGLGVVGVNLRAQLLQHEDSCRGVTFCAALDQAIFERVEPLLASAMPGFSKLRIGSSQVVKSIARCTSSFGRRSNAPGT